MRLSALPAAAARVVRKLVAFARQEGVGRAGLAVVARIGGRVGVGGLERFGMEAYRHDHSGVDTAGRIEPDDLDLDAGLRPHAVHYEATPPYEFEHIVSSLEIDPERYRFVDYGSGKGRVLLMAAEYPFRAVRGVEAAPSLHDAAEANIRAFPQDRLACADVRSVCMNAAEYRPDGGPLIVYLFNPFDEVILAPVLDRIGEAFAAGPGPSYVIYKNPQHEELVATRDDLTLVDRHLGGTVKVYRAEGAISAPSQGR